MASSELKDATAIAEGKKKVSDTKTRGLLGEALGEVEKLGGRLSAMRERTGEATEALLYTGETVGVNFVSNFAEGYWGEEKMDLGSVDGRTVAGVGLGAWGMYDLLRGKGGGHKLAIGTGLLCAGTGRMGRNAGKVFAEKQAQKKGASPAPAAAPAPAAVPASVGNPALPAADGDFGALVRDILLPDNETAGRKPGALARHKPGRFIRAEMAA